MLKRCDIESRQIVLDVERQLCDDKKALLASDVFARVVASYCNRLCRNGSPIIEPLLAARDTGADWNDVVRLLQALAEMPLDEAARRLPQWAEFTREGKRHELHAFVEGLYDYWRSFDRYVVLHSEPGPSGFDQRPYRSFNLTVENLTHIIRATYRDVCENITGDHPRIYRQVEAGCNVALIALRQHSGLPEPYHRLLGGIPLLTAVLAYVVVRRQAIGGAVRVFGLGAILLLRSWWQSDQWEQAWEVLHANRPQVVMEVWNRPI